MITDCLKSDDVILCWMLEAVTIFKYLNASFFVQVLPTLHDMNGRSQAGFQLEKSVSFWQPASVCEVLGRYKNHFWTFGCLCSNRQ